MSEPTITLEGFVDVVSKMEKCPVGSYLIVFNPYNYMTLVQIQKILQDARIIKRNRYLRRRAKELMGD